MFKGFILKEKRKLKNGIFCFYYIQAKDLCLELKSGLPVTFSYDSTTPFSRLYRFDGKEKSHQIIEKSEKNLLKDMVYQITSNH